MGCKVNPVDLRKLRNAFGTFMTGVTVVTAVNEKRVPVGFTANSYTSVSLNPPLVLVCPAMALGSIDVFNTSRRFAINILADDQQSVSNIFAACTGDRFAQVAWRPDDAGCPLLTGAAAYFSCSVHDRVTAGDHLVLIGRVERFDTTGKAGLGYANGGYFSLGLERRAADLPVGTGTVNVGAIIEHDGRILLESTPSGLRPPQTRASRRTGMLAIVRAHLAATELDVEIGPVYSMFESAATGEYSVYYRGSAANDKTGGLGAYYPAAQLLSLDYSTRAVADMMHRYQLERQNGVFCLYVGDEAEGEVHLFGEGAPVA